MHESKRQLGAALAPLLKQWGYSKRALTWHKPCLDTILVFHAGKSRWGTDDYSFHLGVYLRALGPEGAPPHHRCQVQVGFERLVPVAEQLQQASNFADPSLDPAERLSRCVQLVACEALPWLERHSALQILSELAQCEYQALLPRVLVFRPAYDYLRQLHRRS